LTGPWARLASNECPGYVWETGKPADGGERIKEEKKEKERRKRKEIFFFTRGKHFIPDQ